MFNIVLYKYTKKENSTARPNVSGSSYPCSIKDINSILTPVIEIKTDNAEIPLFNYAYIPSFKRYYFIDDVSWSLGTWSISMHVDVLGTYAPDIRNSRQYVIRSASDYDLEIADTMYLTKPYGFSDEYEQEDYPGITSYGTNYVWCLHPNGAYSITPYFNRGLTQGYFIVGIVGSNTAGVSYYVFDNDGFQEFVNEAMTFTPSDMQDVSSGVANAVFNPLQYITSVRWFPDKPYTPADQNKVYKIAVGGYNLPLLGSFTYGAYECNVDAISDYRLQISIPKHPQSASKPYMNLSPFTQLNLVFQPFGCVPLDTTKLLNVSSITVQWLVDFCGGSCVFNVYRSGQTIWDPEGLLYTVSTDFGVQLPISSLVMDWKAGLAISALSFIKETTSGLDLFKKDIQPVSGAGAKSFRGDRSTASLTGHGRSDITPQSGENTNILDRAMDLGAAALGQLSTVGSVGSFLAYMQDVPYIMGWFRNVVEEDLARFGRPLYKIKKLSTLSGFCVCMNATMSFPASDPVADEQAAVIAALNSGIYLEN